MQQVFSEDERLLQTADRLAQNQVFFREVNERLERLERSFAETQTGFMCECSREACAQLLSLNLREYEAVRADPRHFAIVPGHETLAIEHVVKLGGRYSVVEKIGLSGEIAAGADPRTR